jgi:hypothetical protein
MGTVITLVDVTRPPESKLVTAKACVAFTVTVEFAVVAICAIAGNTPVRSLKAEVLSLTCSFQKAAGGTRAGGLAGSV